MPKETRTLKTTAPAASPWGTRHEADLDLVMRDKRGSS